MPGLGAEAMIFLYAGLSGLTVLAGYDVLRWFRRIIRHHDFLVGVEDILYSGFQGKIPSMNNKISYGLAKACRMWHNRWKYSIVYDESLLSSFLSSTLNRIKKF